MLVLLAISAALLAVSFGLIAFSVRRDDPFLTLVGLLVMLFVGFLTAIYGATESM